MTGKIQQKIDFFDFPKTKKKLKKTKFMHVYACDFWWILNTQMVSKMCEEGS